MKKEHGHSGEVDGMGYSPDGQRKETGKLRAEGWKGQLFRRSPL